LQEENDDLNLPIALLSIGKKIATTPYKHLAEKELMMVKLDCLNMLYVNFTRAVERLHIISPKPTTNVANSTYTWLSKYATSQAHYDTTASKIEFGELTPKDNQGHVQKKLEQLQLVSLQFNDENPIKIKNGSAYNSSEESVRAREYGILVHYILSQIKSKHDISSVVQKSILNGAITDQEAVLITTDLSVIMMNEKISAYYEPDLVVKNEFEIVTETGDILRPDRVVIIDETAIVIDYKTGKKQVAKYHSQMQDYKNALLKLGYKTVVKILLYIHEKEVEILN
jgi:ATP-dependent exoDNAse (exonuclease V) beta subunit